MAFDLFVQKRFLFFSTRKKSLCNWRALSSETHSVCDEGLRAVGAQFQDVTGQKKKKKMVRIISRIRFKEGSWDNGKEWTCLSLDLAVKNVQVLFSVSQNISHYKMTSLQTSVRTSSQWKGKKSLAPLTRHAENNEHVKMVHKKVKQVNEMAVGQ